MASPPHIEDCAGHDRELADKFHVHAALVWVEQKRPHLKDNPQWKLLRMDAYEEFWRAMTGGAA
jgi:hypothetical protein